MKSQTQAANTKDWLEATKEMTIRAYVESGGRAILSTEIFEAALRKVSRPQEPPSNEEKPET